MMQQLEENLTQLEVKMQTLQTTTTDDVVDSIQQKLQLLQEIMQLEQTMECLLPNKCEGSDVDDSDWMINENEVSLTMK